MSMPIATGSGGIEMGVYNVVQRPHREETEIGKHVCSLRYIVNVQSQLAQQLISVEMGVRKNWPGKKWSRNKRPQNKRPEENVPINEWSQGVRKELSIQP